MKRHAKLDVDQFRALSGEIAWGNERLRSLESLLRFAPEERATVCQTTENLRAEIEKLRVRIKELESQFFELTRPWFQDT